MSLAGCQASKKVSDVVVGDSMVTSLTSNTMLELISLAVC